MRVMVLIKATKDSETGTMPDTKMLTEMGKFNEELVKAGIMQDGEGLHSSAKGRRVIFKGKERKVVEGPFDDLNGLIAGFWIWKVKSLEDAVEWVKRCPNPMPGESTIEIRQIVEAQDFGDALTPELQEQEMQLREQLKKAAGPK